MNQNLSQQKIHPRPKSVSRHKSPLQRNHPQAKTPVHSKHPLKITPKAHKSPRTRSINLSYDFALDSSNMFNHPPISSSKFFPSAIPSPTFDVQICKEEISRLESQLTHSELLQTRLMRSEWRTAQKSMDIQFTIDQKSYLEYNKKLDRTFQTVRESKNIEAKKKERMWREEEFRAHKAAKFSQEIEAKRRNHDDLLREKTRFLHNQENHENKKNLIKEEKMEKRKSFLEFVQASKEIENNQKIRENREREFEYAQNLGAKWLRLKHKDRELQENLQILNSLMN